jgi:vancomycin resistance protein YoaR
VATNSHEKFNKTVSFGKTIISETDKNRIKNINLALNLINGKIIFPNETFSFNRVVGPRLQEYGYTSASTIVKGNVTKDIGGGICQVASTLYEAILKSDLDILERHPHTVLPTYSTPGKDATVVYGDMDLRFINTSSFPIYISAANIDNQILISLLSSNALNKKVDVVTKLNATQNIYNTYRVFNNDIENKILISEDEYPQISLSK